MVVSPDDCTGCEVCVECCPDDALYLAPIDVANEDGALENWQYSLNLKFRDNMYDKFSAKGS